jgi:1-acyl-sn-glycerol-3-phosphate acyltransferase
MATSSQDRCTRDAAIERKGWLYRLWGYVIVPVMTRLWMRLRVEGIEHTRVDGGLILISNHVDNWDTYVVGLALRGRLLHFMARADGMHSRWLGRYWRHLGAIPADREGLREALRILRDGGAVGVFPEGCIAPALVRAIPGSAVLALRARVPVVPAAVWGTEQIRWWSVLNPPLVRVRYGPPRVVTRRRGQDFQAVADDLMAEVAALLPPRYRGVYAGGPAPFPTS